MIKTPNDAAADWLCPVARTFATTSAHANCRGEECAAWRWSPIPAAVLAPHISKRLKETGGGTNAHKEACAWVMDHRQDLGIPTEPTHGFCGLGGQP